MQVVATVAVPLMERMTGAMVGAEAVGDATDGEGSSPEG
jgi:hypothetical protein